MRANYSLNMYDMITFQFVFVKKKDSLSAVFLFFIYLAAMGKSAGADGAAAFMAKELSAFGAMEFIVGSFNGFVCRRRNCALSFFWCGFLLDFIEPVVAEHLAHLDDGSCNSVRAGSAF